MQSVVLFYRFCSFDGANENVWHILVCISVNAFCSVYLAQSFCMVLWIYSLHCEA